MNESRSCSRTHRAQVLEELEGELARLRESPAGTHSKRVCALRASRRYGRSRKIHTLYL